MTQLGDTVGSAFARDPSSASLKKILKNSGQQFLMESFQLKSFNKANAPTDSEKKLLEEVAALRRKLEKTEKEVAHLTNRLNREPAEQRRQGLEEGMHQGMLTKEEELGRDYDASLGELREELSAVVNDLEQQVPRLFLDFEQTSATLALECVRKVFDESARHLEEGIGSIVKKAVEAAGKTKTLLIKVHPEDLKSVKDAQHLWEPINGKLDSLKIESDPRIPRGSCAVESSSSTVEMTAEKIYQNMCREVELLFRQKAKDLNKQNGRVSQEDDA